jgi:transcriptional regulator with XRE-family HTH domain
MDQDQARHSAKVDRYENAVRAFGEQMRHVRLDVGSPSFRQLARRTNYAVSTLADATTGRRLPSRDVTEAFATACGVDPEPLIAQREAIALTAPLRTDPSGHEPAPSPDHATPISRLRYPLAPWQLATMIIAFMSAIALAASAGFILGHRQTTAGAERLDAAQPTPETKVADLGPAADYDPNGVAIHPPSVSINGTTATFTWTVETNQQVTFEYLQLATEGQEGAGFNPNITIHGIRTFITKQTLPPGSYRTQVVYQLPGQLWINGPPASYSIT